jgi:cysteine synthase
MGTSTYLKRENPAIQIVGAQPADTHKFQELENRRYYYQNF